MSDVGDALVVNGVRAFGRLTARPRLVNPLGVYSGPKRRLKWWRLKEWLGFTLTHPELASSMIIQDAHYLAGSELYVAELEAGRLTQHARNAVGGSVALPAELFGSHCRFRKPGYALEYTFGEAGGTQRIHVDIAGSDGAPAVAAALELHGDAASAPLSVSAALDGGAMYTHKVLYPVSGTLRVGTSEYAFDQKRDLAILDEHHSFFAYCTHWMWGTLGGVTPEGPVGANFGRHAQPAGEPGESCLWTPAGVEPVSEVTFSSSGAWHADSADEHLDVTFTPDGRKVVRHQLGLAAVDYIQFYGTYRGVLRASERSYEIDGLRGVWERMDTRF